MKSSRPVVSLDLCGTLSDCGVYDRMWYEVIPRMYAESKGIGLEEAMREVISSYRSVGPSSLSWYLPSYWIRRFGLSYDEFLRRCGEIKVRVPEQVRKLRELYRVILSTNVSKEVLSFSLEDIFFDEVYSSVDMGYPRKDERFWMDVIRSEGVQPSDVIHLGDDFVYDYMIPSSLGIRASLARHDRVLFYIHYATGVRL
ncbi:MAG: HAD family hydrolase [Nitrososphaeria archaeon]